jgi:glycosyltransferase involved in cell wall biosynthesis
MPIWNPSLVSFAVIQLAKPSTWYPGGGYPADLVEMEYYEPPFRDVVHFLSFESPDEMLERINYLLAHDEERERMAIACYDLAMSHYTSRGRAERFLAHLEREM